MKIKIKKLNILLLIVTLLVSSQLFVYGSEINDEYSVITLSENELLVKNLKDNTATTMNIQTKNHNISIEYYDPYTNKNEKFVYNDIDETIYSSYTDSTVEKKIFNNRAIRSASSTKTYRISFSKLSSMVNDTSNMYAVAGAIIVIVAALAGVSIATGPSGVVAIIGGIFAVISIGLSQKKSGGIYVTLSSKEIVKHHAGGPSKVTVWNISSVGVY